MTLGLGTADMIAAHGCGPPGLRMRAAAEATIVSSLTNMWLQSRPSIGLGA